MKHKLSLPALSTIVVLTSGFVFPLIFTVADRFLRELFSFLDPTLLLAASFAWLLLFYFYGIKFSLEYVTRQFEISDRNRLFRYSNIGFAALALLTYASLFSVSVFSNLLWGSFYLAVIILFYKLSSSILLASKD